MRVFIHRYFKFLCIGILVFAFATRIWHVEHPKNYIFDEVYHAVTAKLIARNDTRAYEWWNPEPEPNTAVDWLHPPLAKYTQAASMLVFGETPLGWRFSSVVFGVLLVFITIKLALAIFEDELTALLAGILVSLDGLVLVQSRLAMNDIHVTFFIVLTLYWYTLHLKNRGMTSKFLWLSGVGAGLAMGSKWSGLFVLLTIWLFEGIYTLKGLVKQPAAELTKLWKGRAAQLLVALVVLPFTLYVASYTHMFLQGKTLICNKEVAIQGQCYYSRMFWHAEDEQNETAKPFFEGYISHFMELHRQIWHYQTTLTATHGYQSRPWQWFWDLRPVWYAVDYQTNARGDIYNVGNPLLFWFGAAAVLITLATLGSYVTRDLYRPQLVRHTAVMTRLSFLVTSYFMVWVLWQFSPRIMFFYHYTPAVPLMSILLAFWLTWMSKRGPLGKSLASCVVTAILICFILWYPHWTDTLMPISWKEKLYFLLPSWR